MVKHSGIVSYLSPSWWEYLLPPAAGVAAVIMWFSGHYVEVVLGCLFAVFTAYWLLCGERKTIEHAEQEAKPFVHLGFRSIEDHSLRSAVLEAHRKKDSEHAGTLTLLRGEHRGVSITITLADVDQHATPQEVCHGRVTMLETAASACPSLFRIGPPLAIGHRGLERFLRAPLSGFNDPALERSWYMYQGRPEIAETLLPTYILRAPWPEERWSSIGGVVRATWYGRFPSERASEALDRLVRTVELINAIARQTGNNRPNRVVGG